MAGLVQQQAFDIRPRQRREITGLSGHFLPSRHGLEGNVFRVTQRLHLVEQRGEREPDPGDDHRPRFDATHAVVPILERYGEQILQSEFLRLGDETVDFHRPWCRFEVFRVGLRLTLAKIELRASAKAGAPTAAIAPPAAAARNEGRLKKSVAG